MNIYRKRKIPDDKEIVFIGDLHGDFQHLDNKLKELNINLNNTFLISVGDIIDRGSKIQECCDLFLNNPNCDMVLGNHELFMLNRYNRHYFHSWFANGGQDTINQLDFDGVDIIADKMLEKFSVILEIEHRGKHFGVIHAEVPVQHKIYKWDEIINKAQKNEEFLLDLMSSRNTIGQIVELTNKHIPEIQGIDYVIHGHTGIKKPLLYKNRLWIDTLYRGKNLTFAKFDYNNNFWNFL